MRDAFGGVFTINFLLVFIFIYIAFTAVSLNYAKAFKVKNAVIDFVEQNEITDLDDYFSTNYSNEDGEFNGIATKDPNKLKDNLKRLGYHKTCTSLGYEEGKSLETSYGNGYCYEGVLIVKKDEKNIEGTNSKTIYYQIITYADWDLGALNKLLGLAGKDPNSETVNRGIWPIKGDAKVVAKG